MHRAVGDVVEHRGRAANAAAERRDRVYVPIRCHPLTAAAAIDSAGLRGTDAPRDSAGDAGPGVRWWRWSAAGVTRVGRALWT